MESLKVFISVGGTATNLQEDFVKLLEDRLRSESLIPCTVGRNNFSADAPLKAVKSLLDECSGILVIALERTFFESGVEKRGGPNEIKISETRLATPWNQIESAMAYAKGLPILVILENGIKAEGLLEKGYDWYVMTVQLQPQSLASQEFNGVLSSWKRKVELYNEEKLHPKKKKFDTVGLTIGELLSNMTLAQIWGLLAALAGLVTAAFFIGQHFPVK